MKKKGRDSESDQRQINRFSIIDLMNKQLATTLKAVEAAIYYSIQSRVDLLVHGEPRVPASNTTYLNMDSDHNNPPIVGRNSRTVCRPRPGGRRVVFPAVGITGVLTCQHFNRTAIVVSVHELRDQIV